MRLLWLPDILRAAGLTVFTVGGWETRGANGPFLWFDPSGLVWHHTATYPTLSTAALLKLLIDGRSDLPGPLANLALERNGVYYVVASGRANHAGPGSWLDMDSNYDVVGIEPANDGRGEPWPPVQLDAYRRGSKAILDRLGKPAIRMCGHKEWAPSRKVDPYGLNMTVERLAVANIGNEMVLREGPGVIDAVRVVQRALNRYGSFGLAVDGIFGPATTAAVKNYQAAADIPATGEVDGVTMGLLARYDVVP